MSSSVPSVLPPFPHPVTDPKNVSALVISTPVIDAEARTIPPLHSNARRYFLLFLFAMAQFIDVYSASAVVVAIPTMTRELNMLVSESTWLINAYALTLAAFLLAGGRIADIWSAKWVFVIGFAWVGIFSLGMGFVRQKAIMFTLRSLSGVGAALTIPSALHLIVHLFPDPKEQAAAISIFGGAGAIANISGLILGGVLLLADWTWIFFFVAIIVLPLSLAAALLIPETRKDEPKAADFRAPKMDYLGTFFLTGAIVLFIYGLTEASSIGWRNATTLGTLIVGFLLFPVFFIHEYYMDPRDALIAPAMWKIHNFTLITVISLVPYFWWFVIEVAMSSVFQDFWRDSSIIASIRFIPAGLPSFFVLVFLNKLEILSLRLRLIVGSILAAGGALQDPR